MVFLYAYRVGRVPLFYFVRIHAQLSLKDRLTRIIEPLIRFRRLELVDVVFSKGSGRGVLKVTIDQDLGVSIDDCTAVSREISALLDVEDIVPGSYALEVSSPGLDRPLKSLEDFMRFSGRLAKVTMAEQVGDKKFLVGRILRVEGENVVLECGGDLTIAVPFNNIKKARLEVEF